MNLFDPRSFSTDWEVMVVDKLNRLVGMDKLWAFAGRLETECGLNVTIDWNTIEFPMGINRSFDQIWQRIQQVTDLASQLVREYGCDLYPSAAHPTERLYNANHIHVGTVTDESLALRLEMAAMRFAPVFGALAANSPATLNRIGGYKSLRIRQHANYNSRPAAPREPHLSQPTGGTDMVAKLYGAQTFEMRITDGASSRRFLAELATIVAAFVHHLGTQPLTEKLSGADYKTYLTNRWTAARDGMQATFYWNGDHIPVSEILTQMLSECEEELSQLGAKPSDFVLIHQMIEKRICQADFVLDLARRYPEPYQLASAHAKLVRHWSVFDEFLDTALALEPIPAPDAEEILNIHADLIGEESHFYQSRQAMNYPPPVADEIVAQLVERGMIRRDVVPDRGILLSRLS